MKPFQFETLDVGVQDEFDKFLQERGVNENVAAFIPDYAAHKEQQVCATYSTTSLVVLMPLRQEYVKWLNKVKRFVDLWWNGQKNGLHPLWLSGF